MLFRLQFAALVACMLGACSSAGVPTTDAATTSNSASGTSTQSTSTLTTGTTTATNNTPNNSSLPGNATPAATPSINTLTITGIPALLITAGSNYDFTPQATDSNGFALHFFLQGAPPWAQFDNSTGRIWGKPTAADVGTYGDIVVSVSNGLTASALDRFTITVLNADGTVSVAAPTPPTSTPATPIGAPVLPVNSAPTITGTPVASVPVGGFYSFTPQATDSDGDSLSFVIGNKPPWARFETDTGRLWGTAAVADAGAYADIVIGASDGRATTSLDAFSITVIAAPPPIGPIAPLPSNNVPLISGIPASVATAGTAYSFLPTSSDADGDALSFSVQNLPAWAGFDVTSGKLAGTPTASDVGTFANILISVSDGKSSANLPAISITVVAPVAPAPTAPAQPPPVVNSAPVLTGVPPSAVLAGSSYNFTPVATDADGDALTFSVTNLPSWASFNSTTGSLTGAPGAGAVGTYANIVISVGDGHTSVSLPTFSITVTQAATGAAYLSWIAPTQNTDGSPLTTLAGYRIFHGMSPTALTDSVQISTPGLLSYVYGNLTPGTHYFAIVAYTSTGLESVLTNTASKTVP